MTDMFISVGERADQPVTEEAEILQLSFVDQIQLAEAILNTLEPTEALRQAFESRKRLIR